MGSEAFGLGDQVVEQLKVGDGMDTTLRVHGLSRKSRKSQYHFWSSTSLQRRWEKPGAIRGSVTLSSGYRMREPSLCHIEPIVDGNVTVEVHTG